MKALKFLLAFKHLMLLSKYYKGEGLMINLGKQKVGTRLLLSFCLLIFLSAANADRNDDTLLLDVDASGDVMPLTDGLMILRSLFGFTDDALTDSAVDETNCQDCDSEEIEKYIADIRGLTFGKIKSVTNPHSAYSIISSVILDSGLVRTKLYAYELQDYSSTGRIDESNPNRYIFDGVESLVNALGTFKGQYAYLADYGTTYSDAEVASSPPISCSDGSALQRQPSDIIYNVSFRNESGAFAFSNRGTFNAGIYSGCEVAEYYYLEGKGAGVYSCVSRAAFYGSFGGGGGQGWSKAYVPDQSSYPNIVVGTFNRETNGLWGTYYLEIDAPADCLNIED